MNGSPGLNLLDDNINSRLLKERIVFLGSEVRDQNANAICAQLLLLSAEDPEADIFLHINSPGGSVDAGMAIYDTMNYIPNDVATVGMGLAASMGQFLLCAGTKGKRYALPHARIMMHQPSSGMGGSASVVMCSTVWPVWSAMSCSRTCLMCSDCWAWILMSDAEPPMPPEGWCIMIRACGRA